MFDLDISAFRSVPRRHVDNWDEQTSPDALATLPMERLVNAAPAPNYLSDIDRECERMREWAERDGAEGI